MVGMNPNGLRGQGRTRKLFAEAKRKGVAILIIQEHNHRASEVRELQRAAVARGFAACVSPCAESSTRGGTAVFLDREKLGLGATSVPFETHLDGRVTIVSTRVLGERVRLASVYAPASPLPRRAFFDRLRRLKIIKRDTIVEGDFNCVPDVALDVRHTQGATTIYPNKGAGVLEALMSRVGLRDVWRDHHGRKARQYTRLGDTCYSRLDRFYAAGNRSDWAWTTCVQAI